MTALPKHKPKTRTVKIALYESHKGWMTRLLYRGGVLTESWRKDKRRAQEAAEALAVNLGFTHAVYSESTAWSKFITYRVKLHAPTPQT